MLNLFLSVLITAFLATPALATECANAGAAPTTAPNDTDAPDATACGNAAVAGGQNSTALGHSASSAGDFSTALGYLASSGGHYSYALGVSASSAGGSSTAIGDNASSAGNNSIAAGYLASSTGISSAAIGESASSPGNNSFALGWSASSSGVASTAIGYDASSVGLGTLALGRFALAGADDSIAVGRSALATGTAARSIALGHLAFADQPDTVIIGSIPNVNFATTYANVGLGTNTPMEAVDVARSAAAARFQLTSFTATASEAPQFIQRRARGTATAPTAVQDNDNLGLFSFRGHNGTVMGGSRATITAQAAGNFTGASTPTKLIFSTTPVGSTTPQQVLVITPDGKVQVKGVNLNVPDYVFEDDYQLMPLNELKSFIDENGHLPGIASAQQVNEEGLDLAGSQMGQLQKIEELTLYALQQEGRLAEQESRLEAQHGQLQVQQERIANLEKLLNRALAAVD